MMMTHNLTKLYRHQIATVGAWNGPYDSHTALQNIHVTNGPDTSNRRRRLARPLGDSVPCRPAGHLW